MDKVNIRQKFSLFTEHWTPKIVGELNGQYVKVAKLLGDIDWHRHESEDELFLVVKGSLTIRLRDGEVHLGEGEFFIVPKGVDHQPVASEEAHIVLFEPKTTAHTGNVQTEKTVPIEEQEWI